MSDDKRSRILAAATAVFAERDFHRVQVSEVATRAGVGKGTVYLYFPTKDALHEVALQASLERLADEVDAAAVADVPVEVTLREIVLSILRFFWRRPQLLAVVQRYEQQARRRRGHRALKAVAQVLARHRLGGTASERHLSAAFLLGLARAGIVEHAPSDRPETVASRIVDCFLHGVGGARVRKAKGAAA
jgi:AcrR family transcriptional regulator